jgi:hypothetical protein
MNFFETYYSTASQRFCIRQGSCAVSYYLPEQFPLQPLQFPLQPPEPQDPLLGQPMHFAPLFFAL